MCMVLDPNQHQGFFGECYVQALAAAAGLTASKPYPDATGEDFTLAQKGDSPGLRLAKIDVQVKSSRRNSIEYREGAWKYRMPTRQFNDLAGLGFMCPRYLILVIVPDDPAEYAEGEQGRLILRHSAYWLSLRHRSEVDERQQGSVGVDVPRRNLLTADSLLELINSAGADEGGST